MKIFVEVKEVWNHIVEVEVPDHVQNKRERAIAAANELIVAGDTGETEYNYTLDSDQWTVRTEREYL